MNERLKIAIRDRADRQNADIDPHDIECGKCGSIFGSSQRRIRRKLGHMWHGPFRVAELCGDHELRLEITGTSYISLPVVHFSKLKRVVKFPDRPNGMLRVDSGDRVDFDESLLPEDSWETELDADEYEVEEIWDARSGRKTRYGRIHKQYLVRWKEHNVLI